MDDRPASSAALRTEFRCPHELRPIDRAIHLGRLAAFDPACRHCEHRHDTVGLAQAEVRRRAELERASDHPPLLAAEQWEGTSAGGLDAAAVRRFAAAAGCQLWNERRASSDPPRVVVGCDGHYLTAELFAAACAGLQWAGCQTIEIGAVSAPELAGCCGRQTCDGGLWIGAVGGRRQAFRLKLWGAGGRPASRPGRLDALDAILNGPTLNRPGRSSGGAQRAVARADYLASLRPLFHGLRALRIVIDTGCQGVLDAWRDLARQSACELIGCGAADETAMASHARRLDVVAARVVESHAHLGMWIDVDGEACQLIDERGRPVASETLLLALANQVCRQRPGATVVVESTVSADCLARLQRRGAHVVVAASTREAVYDAFVEHEAQLAGGPSGRFWFDTQPPAADGLLAVSFLLTLLSQSDRAVSEVLDGLGTHK